MKSIFFFFLIAAILLLPAREAVAGAFSMGRILTVSTDGSLDTIRNPALLAAHKENNSMGFIFFYTPYNDRRYSYDSYMGSWISSLRVRDQKLFMGSMYLSYTRKISTGSVGLAIDADNNYLADYRRNKEIYANLENTNSQYAVMKVSRSMISPRFVFSYGGIVSGNHAIGVQFTPAYSQTEENSSFISVMNNIFEQKHHSRKKIEEISSEVSLGYTFRDAVSQVGIMIRSGRFTLQKTRIYFSHAEFPSSVIFTGSVAEPYHIQYDRGFNIIAGGYRKLVQFIAVAFEGEYRIPIHYGEKNLRYDEFTGFYGITVSSSVTNKGLYSVRGGFEILPSGPVTINLGGGFSTTSQNKNARYFHESKMTDIYTGSLGFDLTLSENILIIIGSEFQYTHERISTSSNYFNSRLIDGPAKVRTISSHLGMSFNF
jgi:hypothetical protein